MMSLDQPQNIKNHEQPKSVSARVAEIRNKLGERLLAIDEKAFLSMMEEVSAQGRLLLKKYPGARTFNAFHILIGSTPPVGLREEDFPGEDSILAFLEKLRDKYLNPANPA
jgi:hypothetical protein